MFAQIAPAPDEKIRHTIDAVFRQRAYDRTIGESLWSRFWRWVAGLIGSAFEAVSHSAVLRWILIGLVIAVALVIIGRAIYVAASDDNVGQQRRTRTGTRTDPWLEAAQLAERGQYTEAAHALYRALLEAFARQDQVVLHPSKTVGDYGRELRRRSSDAATPYREFARSYETVVYGLGTCDQPRYERLLSLVTPLIERPS